MDGEARGEIPTQSLGEAAGARDEDLAGSGWTTTKQAAKVLGVSRRSVQGYVRRGILEAREEGEGVTKRFIVSIDSLNALRERRSDEAVAAEESANLAANAGEGLRHVVDRLEARTVEATELRVRLEITEKAESTVRGRSWPRSAAGGRRPSGNARTSAASCRRSGRREKPV
jgi:hypothetical protein